MNDLNELNNNPGLLRKLGLKSAFFVLTGSMIGSGVFLVASDIGKVLSSPWLALSVWVIAGIISLAGALIFAELGTMYPDAGGQYVFLKKAFNPLLAFLFGWTVVLVIQTGSIAAVAVAFSIFLSQLVFLSPLAVKIFASFAVIVLTLLNSFGIKRGSQVLDAITSLKILAMLIFAASVFFVPIHETSILVSSRSLDMPWTFSAFGVALIAAFWAYDGWNGLTYVSGEIVDPKKNIPWASFLGMTAVTTLYFLINYSYMRVLSAEGISGSQFVAADVARSMGGELAVKGMTFLVILSVIGCLNALILSGARVIYAMAHDKVLPQFLGKVNPKTHSPNWALTIQMLWTCLLIWSGSYDQLFTYVVFAAFIFYGLTAYGVMKLRRTQPNVDRPYKTPLYPYLPIAYLLFTILFTLNAIIEKPLESLAGLTIVLAGIPAYFMITGDHFLKRSLKRFFK